MANLKDINVRAMVKQLVDRGALVLSNAGAPTSGTSGTYVNVAGKGSILLDYTNGQAYVNTGTKASPTWTKLADAVTDLALADGKILVGDSGGLAAAVTPSGDVTFTNAGVTAIGANKVLASMIAQSTFMQSTGTISAADIVDTTAGKFGHAAGQVLVAAPGAGYAFELISLIWFYDYATAAYTVGGNVTVNWSGGGAALTGLVSAANSFGAAADKLGMFVPLAAAYTPLVENAGFNLVSSAAFTQPGTAAGVIRWVANYRKHATGL